MAIANAIFVILKNAPRWRNLLETVPALFPHKVNAGKGQFIRNGKSEVERRAFSSTKETKKSEIPSAKMILKFVKLTDQAITPTRASKYSAGYDLYSAYEYTAPPMSNILVKTDLQIAVPDGCYGRIAPRSGLALKNFIDVGAGVVDQDYRGNVGVVLFNFSKKDFNICKGDRVAQLVCERIAYPELEECDSLDETIRGVNGFGSSGKN